MAQKQKQVVRVVVESTEVAFWKTAARADKRTLSSWLRKIADDCARVPSPSYAAVSPEPKRGPGRPPGPPKPPKPCGMCQGTGLFGQVQKRVCPSCEGTGALRPV